VKKSKRAARKTAVKKTSPKKQPVTGPEKKNVVPYPTAGPKIIDFEEKLQGRLDAADAPRGPRGPGRPRKAPAEPAPPAIAPEVLLGVVKIPFEFWSISQGVKQLAISDDEAKRLAEPLAQLIEHYLPQIPTIAYAWVALAVSAFWVTRPRLMMIAAIKKKQAKFSSPSSEAGGPAAQPTPSGPAGGFPTTDDIKPTKIDQ